MQKQYFSPRMEKFAKNSQNNPNSINKVPVWATNYKTFWSKFLCHGFNNKKVYYLNSNKYFSSISSARPFQLLILKFCRILIYIFCLF